MTVFFPLYYAFLWFWVGPYVGVLDLFYVILILSGVAEMVFIWLPATGKGLKSRVHTVMAVFVFFAMLAAAALILAGSPSEMGRFATMCFFGVSLLTGLVYYFSKTRKHTLLLESVFCASFWVVISVVAHT